MVSIRERQIEGLYIREYLPEKTAKQNRAVLFLHGYPGQQKNYDLAEHLALQGFDCLVMHYRGVWKSEGRYSLAAIYEDVERILKYIESLGFSQDRISLVGTSLGGFVALEMLARHPELDKLILLAPFIHIEHDAEKLKAGAAFLYSITKPAIKNYDYESLLKDLKTVEKLYNPLHKLNRIDGKKILIIHGVDDKICPIEGARNLKTRFKSPAKLIQLQEENHFLHLRETVFDYCHLFLKAGRVA